MDNQREVVINMEFGCNIVSKFPMVMVETLMSNMRPDCSNKALDISIMSKEIYD